MKRTYIGLATVVAVAAVVALLSGGGPSATAGGDRTTVADFVTYEGVNCIHSRFVSTNAVDHKILVTQYIFVDGAWEVFGQTPSFADETGNHIEDLDALTMPSGTPVRVLFQAWSIDGTEVFHTRHDLTQP